MSCAMPKFFNSPYFIDDENGWRLKPDAPPEIVKEFEEFMKEEEGIN